MADGRFQLQVVSPEANLLETPATAVVLRSSDGDLTVLDGHTDLITDVVSTEVRVDQSEGEPIRLAVHGGFLQVETGLLDADGEHSEAASKERSTRATLLAGIAERAEDIDVPRAEQAKESAQARIDQLRASGRIRADDASEGTPLTPEDIELASAEAALARAELRIAVGSGPAST